MAAPPALPRATYSAGCACVTEFATKSFQSETSPFSPAPTLLLHASGGWPPKHSLLGHPSSVALVVVCGNVSATSEAVGRMLGRLGEAGRAARPAAGAEHRLDSSPGPRPCLPYPLHKGLALLVPAQVAGSRMSALVQGPKAHTPMSFFAGPDSGAAAQGPVLGRHAAPGRHAQPHAEGGAAVGAGPVTGHSAARRRLPHAALAVQTQARHE